MTRRFVSILAAGLVMAVAVGLGAQQNGQGQKKTYAGPIQQTFGALNLSLERGASVETDYYPDQTRLVVRTIAQAAVVATSARNLVLVENQEGTVEVTLPTGRRIKIEPGRSDIVGRALVDDPGTISIRIASTAVITVLQGVPAAALSGQVTQPTQTDPVVGSRPETSETVSPSAVTGPQGFGTSTPITQ
jgi:hypothetical protein